MVEKQYHKGTKNYHKLTKNNLMQHYSNETRNKRRKMTTKKMKIKF